MLLAVVGRRTALDTKTWSFVQLSCGQSLLRMPTMPFVACYLQYIAALLPSKSKLDTFKQASSEQRLAETCIMPSSACRLEYARGLAFLDIEARGHLALLVSAATHLRYGAVR